MATIIEMVTHTRLDCVIGSAVRRCAAASPRRSGTPATAARSARGWSSSPRWSTCSPISRWSPRPRPPPRCGSRAPTTRATHALRRFATAIAKYWVCKRATPHAVEALECLGGNGYVEESPMPRLLRDAPLNGIWEGSGNVIALDVLRALAREPDGLAAFLAECELARGGNARLDAHLDALPSRDRPVERAARGRGAGAGASRRRCSCATRPPFVADAFCAARLGGGGRVYGTLPARRRRRGDRRARAYRSTEYAVKTCAEAERARRAARPGLPSVTARPRRPVVRCQRALRSAPARRRGAGRGRPRMIHGPPNGGGASRSRDRGSRRRPRRRVDREAAARAAAPPASDAARGDGARSSPPAGPAWPGGYAAR